MELEVVLKPRQTARQGLTIAQGLMRELRINKSDLLEQAYMDMLEKKG